MGQLNQLPQTHKGLRRTIMANEDENAKNRHWKTPMDMHHVEPKDYSKAIDSANGSASRDAKHWSKNELP